MGTAKPHRHDLASTSQYIGGDHSAGGGNWLFCELDQKSHISLQHNCLDISGRCRRFSTGKCWLDSNRTTLRLAACGDRDCDCFHSGVAVRESACTVGGYMNFSEKSAPTAAILAALSTLACCIPLGFLGAVGLAGISVWAQRYRSWLLVASIAFLCIGSVQLYFRKSCAKRSTASLVVFWAAVVVVILVILFPQFLASLIAG